jgi:hypothetical protein
MPILESGDDKIQSTFSCPVILQSFPSLLGSRLELPTDHLIHLWLSPVLAQASTGPAHDRTVNAC